MVTKAFLDTNVLIDFLISREPHFSSADKIFGLCAEGFIELFLSPHSLTDAVYIVRKTLTAQQTKFALFDIASFVQIATLEKDTCLAALKNTVFLDFEDCVVSTCAEVVGASYIITRNTKDFKFSKVPPITPSDFLMLIEKPLTF